MQAKETTLIRQVEGEKQYVVPLYQRTYSWKHEQLKRLWDDITAQSDLLADETDAPGHFLGSLVLAPTPNPNAAGVQRWLLVDGQQRMTTLLVLVAALRDHLGATGDVRGADRLNKSYLVNEFHDHPDRLKLLPTQHDRPAFEAIVDQHDDRPKSLISQAYDFFRQALNDADNPEDPHDIARVEAVVKNRLELVAITADQDDNVHRIFESLNNTGMKLSQGDLLRNYLFMLMPTRGDEVYSRVWKPMQDALGVDDIETLAYLDMVLRGNAQLVRSDTYRAQQRRFDAFGRNEDAVVEAVEQLASRARHLAVVLGRTPDHAPPVEAGLRRLRAWSSEASRPVALAALERRASGDMDSSGVARALLLVESYVVRRMLAGLSSAGINRALSEVAGQFFDAADPVATLHEYLSQPRRKWPSDDDLRNAVATRNFYWSGRGFQRLFVLQRLEESYGHKEAVDYGTSDVQIEHVMPQTLTPEWLTVLAEHATEETTDELHSALVHRLGNLTLTGYNPDLSNHAFPAKRTLYADSGFALTRALAQAETWTPDSIEQRGRDLADRAVSLWPAPLRGSTLTVDDRWRDVRRVITAVPGGAWTTYGDVGALTGVHPVPLGQFLATTVVPGAWRVLRSDGTVSPGFRFPDNRNQTAEEVLAAEGVLWRPDGSADPVQHLTADELASILGIAVPTTTDPGTEAADDSSERERKTRFWHQLGLRQGPDVTDGVRSLTDHWTGLGGTVWPGRAAETSLIFQLDAPGGRVWPWAVYPSGSLELWFQHTKAYQPFDDISVRDDFRRQVNRVPGALVPSSRLEGKPSIPLGLLVDEAGLAALRTAAEWFVDRASRTE